MFRFLNGCTMQGRRFCVAFETLKQPGELFSELYFGREGISDVL